MMNRNIQPELFEVWAELCVVFSKAKVAESGFSFKAIKKSFNLNQITEIRKAQKTWKEVEVLLEQFSIEEVELLLTLSKSNQVHLDHDFKAYVYLIMTVPAFVAYTTYQVVQYFGMASPHIAGAIGGAIGLLLFSLFFGSIMLGKSLINKFRNLEMTTCLEGIIVQKKYIALNTKIVLTNSNTKVELETINETIKKNEETI